MVCGVCVCVLCVLCVCGVCVCVCVCGVCVVCVCVVCVCVCVVCVCVGSAEFYSSLIKCFVYFSTVFLMAVGRTLAALRLVSAQDYPEAVKVFKY